MILFRQIHRLSVLEDILLGKMVGSSWLRFVRFFLVSVIGDSRKLALFFPAAGNYNGTTLNNEGSNGNYWSSSFNSATNAYNLNFNSSGVHPQNNNNRRYGFSVRPVQHLFGRY